VAHTYNEAVVKFTHNGVPPPVSGVPPPEIAVPPPKVVAPPSELREIFQLIVKWLHIDGPHCIFGQLIFGKIITIVDTRGQILRLKCTKFYFDQGSTPEPAVVAYSTSPDPLVGFKGAYFRGGRGEEVRERAGKEGMRGYKGRRGEGKGSEEM